MNAFQGIFVNFIELADMWEAVYYKDFPGFCESYQTFILIYEHHDNIYMIIYIKVCIYDYLRQITNVYI